MNKYIANILKIISKNMLLDSILKFKEIIILIILLFSAVFSSMTSIAELRFILVENLTPTSLYEFYLKNNLIKINPKWEDRNLLEKMISTSKRLDVNLYSKQFQTNENNKIQFTFYGVESITFIQSKNNIPISIRCINKRMCKSEIIDLKKIPYDSINFSIWGTFIEPEVEAILNEKKIEGYDKLLADKKNALQIYFLDNSFFITLILISISIILGIRRLK